MILSFQFDYIEDFSNAKKFISAHYRLSLTFFFFNYHTQIVTSRTERMNTQEKGNRNTLKSVISKTDHHKLHIISAVGSNVNFSRICCRFRIKMAQTIYVLQCVYVHMCAKDTACINTCCGTFHFLRLFRIIHKHMICSVTNFSTQNYIRYNKNTNRIHYISTIRSLHSIQTIIIIIITFIQIYLCGKKFMEIMNQYSTKTV